MDFPSCLRSCTYVSFENQPTYMNFKGDNCLNTQHQLQKMEKNIHLTCCQNAVCAKVAVELCSSLKKVFQMLK